MWRFIWLLIILVFSVWLGLQIAKDPGLAFFSYRNWSVEMPLWLALLGLLFFIIALRWILGLFDGAGHLMYRWKNWLYWRRKNKSYNNTSHGLIELVEGNWKTAEHNLLHGVRQSDAPLINYLALAKSAHEQGAYDRRDGYLRKAHASAPQSDVVIGLTQAQLQFNQGQLEQALATLNHLRALAPHHPYVLKWLERVYVHLGDWENMLQLLPVLHKAGVINRSQWKMLEQRTYIELLMLASRENNLNSLQITWARIPKMMQKDPRILFHYVRPLSQYPDEQDAIELLLNKALKKSWDPDLAKLYGNIMATDARKQLAHAEGLLKSYPREAIMLLTVGRLCVRGQLWGKARSYFEESLNSEALPETFTAYGQLLEQLGDTTAALESYRDGLNCIQMRDFKNI